MLDIAIKTCNKQQILALEGRAYSQEMIGENNQAISQYKQALKLAENINDKEITRMLLRGLGAVYVSMGKYKLGINLLKDQLKENNSLKEKRECAVILHNIGLTYMRLNKDQKSIGYIQEALQIAIEIRDAQLQAYCYANLGSTYARMKLFEKSLQYLLKAEKNEERTINKSMILANISYCYGCQKQFKLAIDYANKAMNIAKIIDRRPSQGLALAMIANAYWQQGRYFKGLAYLLKSILVHPPWKDADGMLTFVKAIEEIGSSLHEILRQSISKIKLKN